MNNKVNIFDENKNIIATKDKSEINKKLDLLENVLVFAKTPNNILVLAVIKDRKDNKHIYKNKYGATAAGILRADETALDSAKRVCINELNYENPKLKEIAYELFEFEDGVKRFSHIFVLEDYDIKAYNSDEVENLILFDKERLEKAFENKVKFAPSVIETWGKYKNELDIK